MSIEEDLKKYEKELTDINQKLTELETQKEKILRVGIRIEGIVAYLRAKMAEAPNATGPEEPQKE